MASNSHLSEKRVSAFALVCFFAIVFSPLQLWSTDDDSEFGFELIRYRSNPGISLGFVGDLFYYADGDNRLNWFHAVHPEEEGQNNGLILSGVPEAMTLWDRYALLANGPGGLQILDVSAPGDPKLIAAVSFQGDARDVIVDGKLAFVRYRVRTHSGFDIVDIADPHQPKLLSHFKPSEPPDVSSIYNYREIPEQRIPSRICVSKKLVVLTERWLAYFLEISDPTNPKLVFIAKTPPDEKYENGEWEGIKFTEESRRSEVFSAVCIQNSMVYLSYVNDDANYHGEAHGGMALYDLSDIHRPRKIDPFDLANSNPIADYATNNVYLAARGDRLLALQRGEIITFDISTPVKIKKLRNLSFQSRPWPSFFWGPFATAGSLIFIAQGDDPGAYMFDVSDPDVPKIVGRYTEGHYSSNDQSILSVWVSGDLVAMRNSYSLGILRFHPER